MLVGYVENFLAQRAVQFTVYFPLWAGNLSNVKTGASWAAGGNTVLQVSKDGSAFSTLSNIPTEIGNGWYSVVLTASEMTADIVLISLNANAGAQATLMKINTYKELSSAPNVNDTLLQKLQAVWQYLFLKRTVTATQETMLKSDGSTTLTTATLSDNGTTFTKGANS